MIINIVFYEDPNPKDCDVLKVFMNKLDANKWLRTAGWKFDSDNCVWRNGAHRGFIEILERELVDGCEISMI